MEITEEIAEPTSTLTVKDRWLNESLYELHRPQGIPKLQVLFFHGFQRDYENPHLTTWTSRDESRPWPQTWLAEEFPDAQILSVSYFGGNLNRVDVDMYIVVENLISDLLQAKIGQEPRCPVVLVGHSFGGLVVKQLCVKAFDSRTLGESRTVQLLKFVDNVKGVFFYATPHHGVQDKSITLLDPALLIPTGPLLNYVKSLSKITARLNDAFDSLWKQHKEWRIRGLGESLPTKLKTRWRTVEDFIVPEGSSRYSVDFNIAEGVDHFSISQPESKISRSFHALKSLLRDIADDPQLVVVDGHEETGLPHYPIALEKHAYDIQQRLIEEAVLGITGMGGIGKTTLAKKVYNNISREFEYTCFAHEVKTVPVHDLDDWLRGKFHRHGTRMDGAKIEWSNLRGKKALIVMDDIDSQDQLKRLPPLHDFAKGSCIILTSRDEENFKFYPRHGLYKMDFLEEDEAKQLFCLNAFGIEDIPVESNHLSKNVEAVVRKCDGLPLTLEVMGRYLSDHIDAKTWKEAVDQLAEALSIGGEKKDRIWASLRVSYDALEKEQQNMFIEAGTYFFRKSLVKALAAWDSSYKNPTLMWRNLVRRSMVKEGKNRTVWVHEHLRDLSSRFAKDGILRWRSSNADTIEQELSKRVCTTIKVLDASNHSTRLPLNSLAELKELKYLDFDEVAYKGSGSKFPRTLSLLKWTPSRSGSQFPVDLTQMKNLRVLELRDFSVPKRFAEAVGQLTNLRYLSLQYLRGLDHLPKNLGNLSHLKWLQVFGRKRESLVCTSPESFGKLVALEYLELENVRVTELPESFGELSQLEHLKLVNAKLDKLPDSFGKLSSLETLHIKDCPLEHLPNSFSLLSRLRHLTLSQLHSLKELGDSFGRLSALEDLTLWWCEVITRLPDSFSQLPRLEKLDIVRCDSLKDLGNTFGNLPALVSLRAVGCAIDRLPESLGRLISLRELIIRDCKLERLPESLGELNRLKDLHVEESGLKSLPKSFGKLSSLRTLEIRCPVEELPDNFTKVGSVESGLGQSSCLQSLTIHSKTLKELPDSLGMLSSLESLTISGGELESLPESIGQLHSLKKLELRVPSLRCLPVSVQQLSSLREFIFDSDGHDCFPDHFDDLPLPSLSLKLKVDNRLLGRLPEYLSSVEDLTLEFQNLEKIPDELGNLKSLRKLSIKFCNKLESLPDSLGHLSSLRQLHLRSCHNLKRLPHNLGRRSSSQLAPRQGERRDAEEISFPTTGGEENSGELHIEVFDCPCLGESKMRSLGWVISEDDDMIRFRRKLPGIQNSWSSIRYRRKLPDNQNFPGVRILEVMSKVTAKLRFAPS